MKRRPIPPFLPARLLADQVAAEAPLANARVKGLQAKTIDEMLALPDEEIDIGLGALLIGKEYDPDLDIPKYLAQLDSMAVELRARMGEERDPRKLLALLNDYIFTERAYAAVAGHESKRQNLFHVLLQRKEGDCASLSTLYLALAERVRIPLFGVLAPGHLLVRYESGGATVNAEPTARGERLSDMSYATRFRVPTTDAAQSFYMRTLTKRQFLGTLLSNLGAALYSQRRFDDAAQACRKALAINPNYAEAWTGLGAALGTQGRFDEAVEACRKALAINPNYAEAWTGLGAALRSQGKFDEAAQASRNAIGINPKFAEAWGNFGVALAGQGNLNEAVEAHRTSLGINANSAEAWTNLGAALGRQGKFDEAARASRKALAVNPNYAEAWSNLGVALQSQGQSDAAVEAQRKALAINPKLAQAWYNLGVALGGRGRFEEESHAYSKALDINPNCADAWTNLGAALGSQGKSDEAVEAYRKALAINPKLAEPWNNLAVAYYAGGEYAQAWECVRKCQELGRQANPDFLRELRRQMPEPAR